MHGRAAFVTQSYDVERPKRETGASRMPTDGGNHMLCGRGLEDLPAEAVPDAVLAILPTCYDELSHSVPGSA